MEKGHSGKLFFLFYRGEVMRRFRGPWISCWPASHAKRHKNNNNNNNKTKSKNTEAVSLFTDCLHTTPNSK